MSFRGRVSGWGHGFNNGAAPSCVPARQPYNGSSEMMKGKDELHTDERPFT